jgi:hypothetical protein
MIFLDIWNNEFDNYCYNNCERNNYEIFLDEGLLNYKYHEKWQAELKDRIIFECTGLEFNT